MLKSIHSNITDLLTLAADKNDRSLQKSLLDVNEDLLGDLITTLDPFDSATRLVSADRVPSLHLVPAVRMKLMAHLDVKPEDIEAITVMKTQLSAFMTSHFRMHRLHFIASLLDPRLKGNRGVISVDERARAVSDLKQMVADLDETLAG